MIAEREKQTKRRNAKKTQASDSGGKGAHTTSTGHTRRLQGIEPSMELLRSSSCRLVRKGTSTADEPRAHQVQRPRQSSWIPVDFFTVVAYA